MFRSQYIFKGYFSKLRVGIGHHVAPPIIVGLVFLLGNMMNDEDKKLFRLFIYHVSILLRLINLNLDVINIFHLIYLVSFVKYHYISDY